MGEILKHFDDVTLDLRAPLSPGTILYSLSLYRVRKKNTKVLDTFAFELFLTNIQVLPAFIF